MTKDEALKMCLEYIETDAHERKYVRHAIKEALANDATNDTSQERVDKTSKSVHEPEYLAFMDTPQRTWVGLTDEEIDQGLVRTNYAMQTAGAWRDGVEWAIKQLKEKNT